MWFFEYFFEQWLHVVLLNASFSYCQVVLRYKRKYFLDYFRFSLVGLLTVLKTNLFESSLDLTFLVTLLISVIGGA